MVLILPLDIFLKILEHSDQKTKYKIGIACPPISIYALQKLWSTPVITNMKSLSLLVETLRSLSPFYQYKKWITSLSIQMGEINDQYEFISDSLFFSLSALSLKTLSLTNIEVFSSSTAAETTNSFEDFLSHQLDKGIGEIRLSHCTPTVIYSLVKATHSNKKDLHTLDIRSCLMDDTQLENLVKFYPRLTHLRLDQCGCFSDQGLAAVATYCQDICTLAVTLPSYFIQSNTITTKTIDALTLNCPKLQQFICDGQIRILEYIKKPQKKHSFSIIACV